MRAMLFLLCAGLACLATVPCSAGPDPQSVLEKAIDAHGGRANLAKPRMGYLKGTAKGVSPMTTEETFDLPGRWKRVTQADFKGEQRTAYNLAVDGKLWEWEKEGEFKEAKIDQTSGPYFAVVTLLLDLMTKVAKDKAKLTALKDQDVDGQPAVGFRAAYAEGQTDFYFHKTSGLLLETRFDWGEYAPGKLFDTKTLLRDYRDVDGLKLPHRRTFFIKGGRFEDYTLLADFQITEIKMLDKLPENVFVLPGKKNDR